VPFSSVAVLEVAVEASVDSEWSWDDGVVFSFVFTPPALDTGFGVFPLDRFCRVFGPSLPVAELALRFGDLGFSAGGGAGEERAVLLVVTMVPCWYGFFLSFRRCFGYAMPGI
jgi:hypothetical protein